MGWVGDRGVSGADVERTRGEWMIAGSPRSALLARTAGGSRKCKCVDCVC